MIRSILVASLFAFPAFADQAQVVSAKARQASGAWSFDVTIAHPDTGWDHYADGWSVITPDGTELGFRKLHHPHENEQPFTRSLSGVQVPADVDRVFIRAHDSVHGWSDATYEIKLK